MRSTAETYDDGMPGRIRDEDIAEVRARARIDEVVSEHVTLRSAGGGSLKGLCPFHDERSPSFHVTPAKGVYHCFGCQAGGDVLTFLMEVESLTFVEAVEKLAARTGVQLRYIEGGPAVRRDDGKRNKLLAVNAAAADFFVAALASDKGGQAREILARRGFDPGAVVDFGVGFAPPGWQNLADHLRKAGIDSGDLLAAGLVAQGNRGVYDRFRNRLVWPIRDLSGDIVGFGARRVDDAEDSPKYLNTPETPLYHKSEVLYGLDRARRHIAKQQQVVIVEGYTDVMAAHLAGVTTAVATCGTAFGDGHLRVLRRLLMDDDTGGGQIVFTFDSDEAGRQAAIRAFESHQGFMGSTYVAVDPHGLDPADLRLQHGDQAVQDMLARRVPLVEFVLRDLVAGVDVRTAEGRSLGVRRIVPVIAGIGDSMLRAEYARVSAGWLGLPEDTVAAEVARVGRSGRSRVVPAAAAGGTEGTSAAPVRASPTSDTPLERATIQALLQAPKAAGQWLTLLEPAAFDHPGYSQAMRMLADVGGPGPGEDERVWAGRLLDAAPDDRIRGGVRSLMVEPVPADLTDSRYVVSLVARMLDRDAQRRQRGVLAELNGTARLSDQQRRDLQGQYRALDDYRMQLREYLTGGS